MLDDNGIIRYCLQMPPQNLEEEIKDIQEKLKIYQQNKIEYLEYYLKINKWIKTLLYFDESAIIEIEDLLVSIRRKSQKVFDGIQPLSLPAEKHEEMIEKNDLDFHKLIMEKIDKDIIQSNGIFNYFKIRLDYLLFDYFSSHSGNEKNRESEFIHFLQRFHDLINEIESIDYNYNTDCDIYIPSIDGTEKLFKLFQSNINQQRLYKFLLELQQSEDIIVGNWERALLGEDKITFTHGNRNILSFMQVLQNNGLITNYGSRASEHVKRIIIIFQQNKPNKDGDYEYDHDSLVSEYTSRLNKDENGNFYHKDMKDYEIKLKKISK